MSHPLMLAYLYFYVPHGPGPWASPDAGRCGSARQAFHLPVAQTMGSFQTHLSDDGRPILSPVKTISFRVGNIVRLACSPDGEKAVVVMSSYPDGQFTAWLVDLSSQHMIKLKGHSGSITSVAFSPDGAILATGSRDATVKTWSSANGRLLHTYRGHSDTINDVSFDYSGTLLASGSYDKTVLIWEVKSGSILYRLSYNENVGSVDISSTASNILTGRFNVVPVMRNYITRQVVQRFVGHTLPTTAVALSGDSKLVATTSRDGTTRLYDTSSGQSFRVLRGLSDQVRDLKFSPDGTMLAVADSKRLIVYETATGKRILQTKEQSARLSNIAFVDSHTVVSGSLDGKIRIWKMFPRQP